MKALKLAAAVSTLALFGGCSVSGPSSPSSFEANGEVGYDPCSVVDAEEVSAALGTPVTARLLMPTPDSGHECWYEAGVNRREELTFLPFRPPVAAPPTSTPEEPISGIGDTARWSAVGRTGTLNVWHSSGDGGFSLIVVAPGKDGVALRAAAVDVAAKIVTRLTAPDQHRPAAPPKPETAPFDVCQLLPLPDQVDAIGWTPTVPPHGTRLEFVGGPGRGTWECSRYGPDAVLEYAVTKDAVPEEDLAALGAPLPGLPGPAVFVDIPSLEGDRWRGSAVLTMTQNGRLLKLALYDTTDVAARRKALLAMSRVVLRSLRG